MSNVKIRSDVNVANSYLNPVAKVNESLFENHAFNFLISESNLTACKTLPNLCRESQVNSIKYSELLDKDLENFRNIAVKIAEDDTKHAENIQGG